MLYLVATPIGNLTDITLRALEILKSVDCIASEDTRKTGMLLKRFEIKNRQIAFHEHNKEKAGRRIMDMLSRGRDVALVSNAGTPGISDPGFTLVRMAIQQDIEVTMVPGATALAMAVVLSGLATHSFTFRGFPPRSAGKRRKFLEVDVDSPHTLIYYESPYRLKALLSACLEVFGDRRAAIAKELTKMFESVRRATLSELLESLEDKPKGEYVLVVAGAREPKKQTTWRRPGNQP